MADEDTRASLFGLGGNRAIPIDDVEHVLDLLQDKRGDEEPEAVLDAVEDELEELLAPPEFPDE
jgi:hypothetical protein